jgi:hypothetical protein
MNNIYALMRNSTLLARPRVRTLPTGTLDQVMLEGKRFGQAKYRRLYSNRAEVEGRLNALIPLTERQLRREEAQSRLDAET